MALMLWNMFQRFLMVKVRTMITLLNLKPNAQRMELKAC